MGKTHYLSIIRKADFIDLFKYGHFTVHQAVSFDGDVMSQANNVHLFDMLTCRMNMFEYSFEYLIIHFTTDGYKGNTVVAEVQNVQGIYTFDNEAKKEMLISFDSRIQLHVSPWSSRFGELQRQLETKQSLRGIDNLWSIFGLPVEDKLKCERIITPEIVNEVFSELYSYERPSGELSLWIYLLRYERHSFYPKDMRGFFCDFIHVVCNWMKKQEISEDVAESTALYPQLINVIDTKFKTLDDITQKSPLPQMTDEATGCKFSVVAPLFLFLKDKFKDGMEHKPDNNFIGYTNSMGFEGALAVYLLGIALGYDKTYDAFYEAAELPFFKKKIIKVPTCDYNKEVIVPSKINESQKEDTNAPKSEEIDNQRQDLFDQQIPLAFMYKGRKGTKNYDYREPTSIEEMKKLEALGYKKYKNKPKK